MHMCAGWSTATLVRTLVRAALLAGASVAGFVLFSLLAGPAHADSPGDGPPPSGPALDFDGLLDLAPLPDLPEPEPKSEPAPEPVPAPEPAPAPEPVPAPEPAPAAEATVEPAGLVGAAVSTVDTVVTAATEEIIPLPVGEVSPVLQPVTEPVDQLLAGVGETVEIVETTVSSPHPAAPQVITIDPLAGAILPDQPEFVYPSDLPAAPATMVFTAEPVSDGPPQAVPLPPRTGPVAGARDGPAAQSVDPAGSTGPAEAGARHRLPAGPPSGPPAAPTPGGGACHPGGASADTGQPVPGTTPYPSSIPPAAGVLRIPEQLLRAGLAFSISPLPG